MVETIDENNRSNFDRNGYRLHCRRLADGCTGLVIRPTGVQIRSAVGLGVDIGSAHGDHRVGGRYQATHGV